ncbi:MULTISPECIES: phosphomannomutase [unclassified Methylophilus]|uniref:phosphomannomutase n=1 Tax=unclassified Methylophilus TaxID=2630143 RepID=UPI000AC5A9BC|nr:MULTISPECIES: phosphomannomutase [unclassified Methylophilus]
MAVVKVADMPVLQTVMQQSGVAFGTSGARGLVDAMTDEVCAAYTQAFVKTVQGSFAFKQVAIAVDLRPSSPRIAEACAKMLRQLGLEVIFCGAIPTPALALFAQTRSIPGIMVTGSHIPFDRNGLKFYRPDGEITKSDESSMLASELQELSETVTTLPEENPQAKAEYIKRYKDLLGAQALTGLKLAIYQHSSVARDVLHSLLSDLGAEVVCLERSDIFVPIDTEAVSAEDTQRGLNWAAQYQVDAIISTDGDGDRPLISDEQGNWLRGDIVGLLTAKALHIKHLAVPVSCNTAIEASGFFQQVARTRIGSPFVIAGMQALQKEGVASVAGFEANGGFLLGSRIPQAPSLQPLPTRDAVLPVVTLLAQVKTQGKPLSQLVAALPQRFTASDRLQNFPTEKSKALLSGWTNNPSDMLESLKIKEQVSKIDTTDGLRATLQSGSVVHLRPSGNAPEFRCYIEETSQLAAQSLLASVMGQLKQFA